MGIVHVGVVVVPAFLNLVVVAGGICNPVEAISGIYNPVVGSVQSVIVYCRFLHSVTWCWWSAGSVTMWTQLASSITRSYYNLILQLGGCCIGVRNGVVVGVRGLQPQPCRKDPLHLT